MLHILLLILKIIGILLLLVLGLLMLVLLTVLLIPLRYRLVVEHGEAFYLKGRAHWLLHLLHAEVTHIDGVLHIKLRILGFVLYDNLSPKKPKTKKKRDNKRKARVKKRKKRSTVEAKGKGDKLAVKQNTGDESIQKPEVGQEASIDQKQEARVDLRQKEVIPDRLPTESTMVNHLKADTEDRRMTKEGDITSSSDMPKQGKVMKVLHKVGSFFRKLCELLIKLVQKLQRIRSKIILFFIKIKDKIKGILTTLSNLKRRWNLIYDFLQEEINKEGFQVTWHSVKRLLKHIMPTKLHSTLIFGTGDPCSTGQLLGLMGILYSFYGDRIRITPDFQNKRMEGKHEARGRIRMITVLMIVVKLLMDKRFKQLQRNVNILKEAL